MLDPEDIAPDRLVPRNPPIFPAKRVELAAAMRRDGWRGRPLLVVQVGRRLQALTGSHRIYAARDAGLATVPAIVLREGAAHRAVEPAFRAVTRSMGWSEDAGRLYDAAPVANALRRVGYRSLGDLLMQG